MNSDTVQWWEVLFTVPSFVAFLISAWNLRDANRDLRFLERKKINGLRQGQARTAWDAEYYRLWTTATFTLIGVAAMFVPFNPAPQSAVSRVVTTTFAIWLAALAIWGVSRMRGLRHYVRGEAQKEGGVMANQADANVVVRTEFVGPNPFQRFMYSRRFWLLVFAVVQAIVAEYLDVTPAIWQSISALVGWLILNITIEDFAEKWGQASAPALLPPVPEQFTAEFTDAELDRLRTAVLTDLIKFLGEETNGKSHPQPSGGSLNPSGT